MIVLTVAVTLYHRIQAASSKEPISRKEEGYLFAFALRMGGLLLSKEERALVERFGQPYLNYIDRTGRFIPRTPKK